MSTEETKAAMRAERERREAMWDKWWAWRFMALGVVWALAYILLRALAQRLGVL